MTLGRRLRVDEGAIVRHQQQPGRIVIESSHRLQLAPAKLFRQDRQHARILARFARTFEIGRLVECDVEMLAVSPLFVKQRQHQPIGVECGLVVGHDYAIDRDLAVVDQAAAIFAGAETLRLQDPV